VLLCAALAACGGAKTTGSSPSKGGGTLCPGTPEEVRTACGCKPSEELFVKAVDGSTLGAPAKAAARQCANGKSLNALAETVACVKTTAKLDASADAQLEQLRKAAYDQEQADVQHDKPGDLSWGPGCATLHGL